MAAANVRGWKEEILQNIDSKQIEPVDLFYKPLTYAGLINGKKTAINGQAKYARIFIQLKSGN